LIVTLELVEPVVEVLLLFWLCCAAAALPFEGSCCCAEFVLFVPDGCCRFALLEPDVPL